MNHLLTWARARMRVTIEGGSLNGIEVVDTLKTLGKIPVVGLVIHVLGPRPR